MRGKFEKSLMFILIMMLAVVISACNSTENITAPTGTPSATEAPSATEKPEVTEAPGVTEAPEVTEAPAVTDVPEVTVEPEVEPTDVPGKTDKNAAIIPIRVETEQYSFEEADPYRVTAYFSCDKVSLAGEYASGYPLLQAAFDKINSDNEGAMAANADFIAENLADTDTESEFFIPLFSYRYLRAVRADDNAVSLLKITDNYFAMSSTIWYEGYNVNPSTGKEIGIGDIVGDRSAFSEMIAQRLEDRYGELLDIDRETLLSSLDMLVENESMPFVIGYDGFTFYLKDMIIGGYMDTTYAVTVSFADAEASDAFSYDPALSCSAEDYIIQLPFGYGADYMLNGSENPAVNLMVAGLERNEFNEYNATGIYADFDTMVIDETVYGYEITPYLVKNNGKFYFYIQYINSSDDEFLAVYKLSKGKAVRQNEEGPLIGFTEKVLSGTSEEMEILTRNDMLGTTFEKAMYTVGKNGMPAQSSKYLEFVSPIELTLSVPFEIGAIDPEIAFDPENAGTGEFDYELEFAVGDKLTAVYASGDHSSCQIFCTNSDGEWGTFTCGASMINNMWVGDVFSDAPNYD